MTEPTDVTAYKEGVRLFKEGNILEAMEKFKVAARTGQDRPMEHFALAAACMQLGDHESAEREYRTFLDMEPGMPQQEHAARKALARVEKQRKEAAAAAQSRAEGEQDTVSRERLDGIQRLYDEAVAFFRGGGYGSALKRLDVLARSWGRTAEVLNLVGLCHKHLANYDRAQEALEEAHRKSPENQDVSLNLAQLHFERGVEAARALLHEVLQQSPTNASAWYNLGVLELAAGNTDAASEAWCKAAEIDPDDRRTQASLAMVTQDISTRP